MSELEKLIKQLESGEPLDRDPELLELAQKAIEHQAKVKEQIARGEFDVEAWAKRIAEDVIGFDD